MSRRVPGRGLVMEDGHYGEVGRVFCGEEMGRGRWSFVSRDGGWRSVMLAWDAWLGTRRAKADGIRGIRGWDVSHWSNGGVFSCLLE